MARITTNMPDDLKTRIGEAATAEKVSESAWIARACQTVLDGPADPEEILWRDREIATLDRRVQDYEAELKTLRTVVEEIRMVRTRQERIAEEQQERFALIGEVLQQIRSEPAAPQLPPATPVYEPPVQLHPAADPPQRRGILGRLLGRAP